MITDVAHKPFSQACENNKDPILHVLIRCFARTRKVLEIGSGTGQHAVHFARHMPHLHWQTSDLRVNHAGIRAQLEDHWLENVSLPIELDVDQQQWPDQHYDGVFTANTLHIMSWGQVEKLFRGLNHEMLPGATLAIYGPFNYDGKFTSQSNRNFDVWLKQQNPLSGIRDYEDVSKLAKNSGFQRREDNAMPANNRLLVWQKI